MASLSSFLFVIVVCGFLLHVAVGTSISGLEISTMYTPPTDTGPVAYVTNGRLLFTAKTNSFLWNSNTGTVVATVANAGSAPTDGIAVQDMGGGQFRALTCFADKTNSVYYFSIDTIGNSMALLYSTPFGSGGGSNSFCWSDMTSSFVWMFRGDKKITRGGFSGTTWAQGGTTDAYSNFNGAVVATSNGTGFLLTNSKMMAVPLNYSSALTGKPWGQFNAGIGNLLCGAVDDAQNLIFLGTDIGIGLKFTIGQWNQLSLFYIGTTTPIQHVMLDTAAGVSYWISQDGRVYRVNYDNFFNVYDYTTSQVNDTTCGVPGCNNGLWGGVTMGDGTAYLSYTKKIVKVQLYDCGVHTTCSSCVTDPYYCGWCLTTGSCVSKNSCPANTSMTATPSITDQGSCPVLSTSSPTSGSTAGNTLVTISANYFLPNAQIKCRFNGITIVPLESSTANTITCRSPAVSYTGPVTVDVVYLNTQVMYAESTQPLSFTYYACNASTTCQTCYSTQLSECGWCAETGLCVDSARCSNKTWLQTAGCPTFTGITPSNGPDTGGSLVTITGTLITPTSLTCQFGTAKVNATFVNSTALSCITPRSPVFPGNSNYNVDIQYLNSATLYAPSTVSFNYYNCSLSTSCTTCLEGDCVWCLESGTCTAPTSSCLNNNKVTQCPVVTSANPFSIFAAESHNITVSGSNFFNSNLYFCHFGTSVTPATYQTPTSIQCTNPELVSTVVNLTVYLNTSVYAVNSIPFTFYDCNATSCGSCVSLSKPKCSWCLEDSSCTYNATCSATSRRLDVCPVLNSINPSRGIVTGGTLVTVAIGSAVTNNVTGYQCNFGVSLVNASLINNASAIQCHAPPASQLGTIAVTVYFEGKQFTPDYLNFTYYNCSDYEDDCYNCVAVPNECQWCIPGGCSTSCAALGLNQCPVMTGLSPNHTDVSGGVVTVEGVFSATEAIGYQCIFGNVAADATWISPVEIQCHFPQINASVGNLSVEYNGNPFSLNYLPFEFHDCGSANQCSICYTKSQYCGWCAQSVSCSTSGSCGSGLFIANNNCPLVNGANPNTVPLEGGTIQVTGNQFISGLTCNFGQSQTPATYVSATTLTCVAPARNVSGSTIVDFWISSQGKIYDSRSPLPFQYIDCNTKVNDTLDQRCSSCLTENAACAWCSESLSCTLNGFCSLSASMISSEQLCPAIFNLNPPSADPAGGTVLTVNGLSFLNSSTLTCTFADTYIVNATFISSSVVQCIVPSYPKEGSVHFYLSLHGRQFTYPTTNFTYKIAETAGPQPINNGKGGSNTGLIVGLVVGLGGALLLALAIAIVIFLYYRRNRSSHLKLTEPDYMQVAFNVALPNYKLDKSYFDGYNQLEEILLQQGLFNVIAETCAPTEADKLTKSLTYILAGRGSCVRSLSYLFSKEVSKNQAEGTLFRNDSFASKMFAQYCKLCGGLPYLWKTLAYPVNEIALLGTKENEPSEGNNSISLMQVNSLEVDPSKMESISEQDLVINQLQLLLIAQKMLKKILQSRDDVPLELRALLICVKDEVQAKFPNSVHTALGGQFFLRFMCPSITAPHFYGLMTEPPANEAQRYLVLLSKILQNLANNTLPGKKEGYMEKMNDFIISNQAALRQFFNQLVEPVQYTETPVQLPKNLRENALAHIHQYLVYNQRKITDELQIQTDSEAKNRLVTLLDQMGQPVEQNK